MKILWVAAALLFMAGSADAAVRYVSNTGTATSGCTTDTPATARCHMVAAIAAAVAGDTIEALAGTTTSPAIYQGANYMITVSSKNGTSGSPFTVVCKDASHAAVGGGCLLDGQFVRNAITITSSNYWTIEDFNAKNGVDIVVISTSQNVTLRRIMAWDVNFSKKGNVFLNYYSGGTSLSTATRVIDSAFFGTSTITCSNFNKGGNGYLYFQRVYCRNDGSQSDSAGHESLNMSYGGGPNLCDNCLVTWFEHYPTSWRISSNIGGSNPTLGTCTMGGVTVSRSLCDPASTARNNNCGGYAEQPGLGIVTEPWCLLGPMRSRSSLSANPETVTTYFNGSVSWIPSTTTFSGNNVLEMDGNTITINDRHLSHVIGYFASGILRRGTGTASDVRPGLHLDSPGGGTSTVDHTTTISTANDINVRGGWTVTNGSHVTAIGSAPNPWTNTGAGANLCFQWNEGAVTATPLWPWTMNQRIKDATTQAGSYAGPCLDCTGTFTTRPIVDITAEMEAMFGSIPATCRSDTAEEPFPDFTGYNPATISTFSGSATPPTGFAAVSGDAWTEAGGVATPPASFSTMRYDTLLGPNQQAAADISTLPTDGGAGVVINFWMTSSTKRHRVRVERITGTNNDTVTLDRVSTTEGNLTYGVIDLGRDMAITDRLGVKVTDTTAEIGYYADWSGTTEWKLVGTFTLQSTPPDSSYIGFGAALPAVITTFYGSGDALADSTAPTAPSDLSVTPQAAIRLDLSWTASTDAVGVTEYRIYRGVQSDCSDCVVVGTSASTTYSDGSATAGTTHYYKVTARDAALNESSPSSTVPGRVPDGTAFAGSSGRVR